MASRRPTQPLVSSDAQAIPGARLVKGFNHLVAAVLDQDPTVQGAKRAVFLASENEGAAAEIGELAKKHAGHGVARADGRVSAGMANPQRSDLEGRLATTRRSASAAARSAVC